MSHVAHKQLELGLSYAPTLVATSAPKNVKLIATALGFVTEDTFLWDDNQVCVWERQSV